MEKNNIEIKRENLRDIVGQLPPSLTRYGISVICLTLLVLFFISVFFPYKQHYHGTSNLVDYNLTDLGYIIYLEILVDANNLTNNDKLFIFFTDLEEELKGEVLEVTYSKIGIGKYNAKILIPQKSEIIDYKKQNIRIVREEKFLIKKIFKIGYKD